MPVSKEKKERERLPDDAATAAAVKAALFMTSFGLGGLEGPEAADSQTGGQSDRQTDGGTDRRSFSGGFCTSAFLPSLQVDNFSESREKRGKSHKKRRPESGRRKATNDGRPRPANKCKKSRSNRRMFHVSFHARPQRPGRGLLNGHFPRGRCRVGAYRPTCRQSACTMALSSVTALDTRP